VQKIRIQKFSAILKKSKVNFLLESCYFFEQKVLKHIFAVVLMQICACLKKHMREAVADTG